LTSGKKQWTNGTDIHAASLVTNVAIDLLHKSEADIIRLAGHKVNKEASYQDVSRYMVPYTYRSVLERLSANGKDVVPDDDSAPGRPHDTGSNDPWKDAVYLSTCKCFSNRTYPIS
jgi:hypothetical protein